MLAESRKIPETKARILIFNLHEKLIIVSFHFLVYSVVQVYTIFSNLGNAGMSTARFRLVCFGKLLRVSLIILVLQHPSVLHQTFVFLTFVFHHLICASSPGVPDGCVSIARFVDYQNSIHLLIAGVSDFVPQWDLGDSVAGHVARVSLSKA